MNNQNEKLFNALVDCDSKITIEKFAVIKNQYILENWEDFIELKNKMISLNNQYSELQQCLPNVHFEYGQQNNKPFLKNMISILNAIEERYENKKESLDFLKLKKSIRVITIYQEYENQIESVKYYSRFIASLAAPTQNDINGNEVVVAEEKKEKFENALEQQKKLLKVYEEAKLFVFGVPSENQTVSKGL